MLVVENGQSQQSLRQVRLHERNGEIRMRPRRSSITQTTERTNRPAGGREEVDWPEKRTLKHKWQERKGN